MNFNKMGRQQAIDIVLNAAGNTAIRLVANKVEREVENVKVARDLDYWRIGDLLERAKQSALDAVQYVSPDCDDYDAFHAAQWAIGKEVFVNAVTGHIRCLNEQSIRYIGSGAIKERVHELERAERTSGEWIEADS